MAVTEEIKKAAQDVPGWAWIGAAAAGAILYLLNRGNASSAAGTSSGLTSAPAGTVSGSGTTIDQSSALGAILQQEEQNTGYLQSLINTQNGILTSSPSPTTPSNPSASYSVQQFFNPASGQAFGETFIVPSGGQGGGGTVYELGSASGSQIVPTTWAQLQQWQQIATAAGDTAGRGQTYTGPGTYFTGGPAGTNPFQLSQAIP